MSLGTSGDRNLFAQRLFKDLPTRYDHLAEWSSFWQNSRWRKAMVDHIVPGSPRRVLDVASGTAGVALQLADRTSAHVVGVDLTLDMLRIGQRNVAKAHRVRRVQLVNGRAEALPFADAVFDAFDLHIPVPVRGRSPGDTERVGPRRATWRPRGEPRVPCCPRTASGARAGGLTRGWLCQLEGS